MEGAPLVSVPIITFDQQQYIAAALDSALSQQTSFPYEIIVGEDCSRDGTRGIVLDYARRFPDRIRPLLHDRNLGAHRNFMATLRACRGKYVALLEGDDYWIRADKLQKQVEALEAHPEAAICAARARVVYEDASRDPWEYPLTERTNFGLEDLLRENFIPNCTAVYRIGLLLEIPEWYPQLLFGDWALHTLVAQYGNILLLPETMAVYRVHSRGLWGTQSAADVRRHRIEYYDRFEAYLPAKYRRQIAALKSALRGESI
jgi:glycosyltransferase involved in cell wall biosynthesis